VEKLSTEISIAARMSLKCLKISLFSVLLTAQIFLKVIGTRLALNKQQKYPIEKFLN
jgi:hypothetical protein